MNMINKGSAESIADFIKILGSPFRIKILYVIGYGEACVCHLEAILKKRQAYISQHLMVMRDAGLLSPRRDGKFIYYRVTNQEIFTILDQVSELVGVDLGHSLSTSSNKPFPKCVCPKCEQKADIKVLLPEKSPVV